MVVHDIDTVRDYAFDNWDTAKVKPIKIFVRHGKVTNRLWKYKRSMELFEEDTNYALGSMNGNFDRENDTVLVAVIRSKNKV